MGRKAITDKDLETDYFNISCYLILHDKASADEITEVLDISKGRLSKALQYGRRNFPEKTKIDNLVLGGPSGYFIPDNKEEVIAWYLQYKSFAASLNKTIKGVGAYITNKYPKDLEEAQYKLINAKGDEEDPWSVFNNLI